MLRAFPASPTLAKVILYMTATMVPFVAASPTYAAWFRAWQVMGHAPRPLFDDPKHICSHDAVYQWLSNTEGLQVVLVVALCLAMIVPALQLAESKIGLKRLSTYDSSCLMVAIILATTYIYRSGVSEWSLD